MRNPFRYFNSSPEVIGLTVMMYVRYPLSLHNVEDLLLFERGIDICRETVRFWGSMFAAAIRNPPAVASIFQATSTAICVFRRSLKKARRGRDDILAAHRSRRAELPHRSSTSGHGVEPPIRIGAPQLRAWQPTLRETHHSSATSACAAGLAAAGNSAGVRARVLPPRVGPGAVGEALVVRSGALNSRTSGQHTDVHLSYFPPCHLPVLAARDTFDS